MRVSDLLARTFAPLRYLSPALIAAMVAAAPLSAAHAQTYTWTGGGFGAPNTWSASGNWTGGTPQSGFNTQIVFGTTSFDKKTANNDLADLVLNVLRFTDLGYTISGNSLTFVGASPQLVQTVSGTNTIANDISFANGMSADIQISGGNLILGGRVNGAGTFTKLGRGNLTLSGGTSTIDGPVSVNSGGIILASGAQLTTGNVNLGIQGSTGVMGVSGAGSRWNVNGNLVIGNAPMVNGAGGGASIQNGGTLTVAGETRISLESGLSVIGGTLNTATLVGSGGQIRFGLVGYTSGTSFTLNQSGDSTYSGTIAGAGVQSSFTKLGVGALNLTSGGTMDGSLFVQEGTLSFARFTNDIGYVGCNSTVPATVNVSGATGQWNNTRTNVDNTNTPMGSLYIGNNGTGTVNATGGAKLISNLAKVGMTGGTGTINLSGTGTRWTDASDVQFGVDNGASGTLTVSNAAQVSSKIGYLAYGAGSNSSATVSGTNSRWEATQINVGQGGAGTLTITNGGTVLAPQGTTIGSAIGSSGTVTVSGAGSLFNSGALIVGSAGSGSLSVLNGATAYASNTILSRYGAPASLVVDGIGSRFQMGTISAGGNRNGAFPAAATIDVTGGGSLESSSNTFAFRPVVNVRGAGSQWLNYGNLNVNNGATVNITAGGLIRVSDKAFINETNSIAGDTGTVSISGTNSWLDIRNALEVGRENGPIGGRLLVTNGGKISASFATIQGASAPIISDSGSQMVVTGALLVGAGGAGTLNVRNGALLSTYATLIGNYVSSLGTSGAGTINIDGAGTRFTSRFGLNVGYGGNATLNITNGGVVTSGNEKTIGAGQGGGKVAVVNIDGSGSQWLSDSTATSTLRIADANQGTLNITNGGILRNNDALVGYYYSGTGTVNVSGAGSQWLGHDVNGAAVADTITVGNLTTGTVNITNGGFVTKGTTILGSQATGRGTINIDGEGSLMTTNELRFGDGKGAINLTNGGKFIVTGAARLSGGGNILGASNGRMSTGTFTGDGTVEVSGGELRLEQSGDSTFDGVIRNGATSGTFTKVGAGALTLTNTSTHGTTAVGEGTLNLAASGVLAGNVNVTGGTFANNGTVNGLTMITGGVARGSGNYAGGYVVQNGGAIQLSSAPGIVRSGSATWNNGGALLFAINNAAGAAGTNWGLNQITGNLSLASSTTPFTIVLQSLLPGTETGGALTGFDASQNYTWDIVQATAGITGFDAARFLFDTSAFSLYNPGVTSNQFSLTQLGNTLRINYTSTVIVVPETGTGLLATLGSLVGLVGIILRRRK